MHEDTETIDRALIADELIAVAKLALIRKLTEVAVDIQELAERVRYDQTHNADAA